MPVLIHHPRMSFFSLITPSFPLNNLALPLRCQHAKTSTPNSISLDGSCKFFVFTRNRSILESTRMCFCSKNEVIEGFTTTQLPQHQENKVELLDKPSPKQVNNGDVKEIELEAQKPSKDEALKPFLKFFKPRDSVEQPSDVEETSHGDIDIDSLPEEELSKKVSVEYYEPKPGDFVVGVVVSGNENKLDVNVGADLLGTMLTKEVRPLYEKELDNLLCDTGKDAGEFLVTGKMGIVRNEDALNCHPAPGKPVVEPGTVLFAEVLGRTLSGRPLLSTRRLFRRVSWHRVRQIKQLNQPIEIKITEWNTGGLLARIEGLRAFLPKDELVKRISNFTELKETVGCRIYVHITRINEDTNDLILSEKEAWNMLNLKEGTLLEGTVMKIFLYGAQVRIGESNRSGLLHISNISRARVSSVSDVLAVGEKVKVLVVKSMFPEKIFLSIAELESEPGLFLLNKEKVYSEAEQMVKRYLQKLPTVPAAHKLETVPTTTIFFEDEARMYANWKWFKFERDTEPK